MLDQLTDRAGTACLMMTLATFYPQWTFWFQLSMAIDITCHWLYLHTVTLQGKTSHKFIDMSENPIMHVYYTNKTVLFSMCAGNEAFYAALYIMNFYTGPRGKVSYQLSRFYDTIISLTTQVSNVSPIFFSPGNGPMGADCFVLHACRSCQGWNLGDPRHCGIYESCYH